MPGPACDLSESFETLFFPSRLLQRLEEKPLFRCVALDLDEATGQPRLTTSDIFGPKSRNGLFVGNNPVNASDPMGTDAIRQGDHYIYVVRPGLDLNILAGNPVRNPNPLYDRQCATGCQFWAGTSRGGVVHDVPKASSWTRGANPGADTQYGTVIASGWEGNAYPGKAVSDYTVVQRAQGLVNHVALFVSSNPDGTITIFDQSAGADPTFRNVSPDGWAVVNGDKPYDKAASDSYLRARQPAGLGAIQRFGATAARAIFGSIDGLAFAGSIDGFQTWNGLGDLPIGGASPSAMETTAQP